MPELLDPAAGALWASALRPDDRVLVTGASGWFGKTTVGLLAAGQQPRMLVAGSARTIAAPFGEYACVTWDSAAVADFDPTVVIDCAFLTRDLVATMSFDDYVAINRQLTDRLLDATHLPAVRAVVTVSSGAAVYPVDARSQPLEANPYGWLKRDAEDRLEDASRAIGVSVRVARAWSVSGAFVAKPRSYALSDFILQARVGHVTVAASAEVYRRYVSVEDLLAVALADAAFGGSAVIDSGGELVEMRDLAARVVAVVNPDATVSTTAPDGSPANRYYSDNETWTRATNRLGFSAADLDSQIETANLGLAD